MTSGGGFSLIELAIVLVILGLLVGGILVGQSLIRVAELRSVSCDYQRYAASAQTFRVKYLAIPGDMSNATDFWGKDNTNCPTHTGTAATPGTCNGNGDGVLDHAAAANGGTAERFQFWKQLQLANLVEGSYTGLSGSSGTQVGVHGVNQPRSRISDSGWRADNAFNYPGNTAAYALDYGNFLMIHASPTGTELFPPMLRPEEAWNIDTKLDDGRPAYGKVIARFWDNLCSAADDGTNANNDLNASYRLTDSSIQCALYFTRLF